MSNAFAKTTLLESLNIFNDNYNILRLSPSHKEFLSAIPSKLPLLLGFEYHLTKKQYHCDTLICINIMKLQAIYNILSHLNGHDEYRFISKSCAVLNEIITNQNLLLLIDHIWLELDAAPLNHLSTFVGSISPKQARSDQTKIIQEVNFIFQQINRSMQKDELSKALQDSFNISNYFFDSKSWLLSEIGFMARGNRDSHLKILYSPAFNLTLSDLEKSMKNFQYLPQESINYLKKTGLIDKLEKFPHKCQISTSLQSGIAHFALEIMPQFNYGELTEYQSFWSTVSDWLCDQKIIDSFFCDERAYLDIDYQGQKLSSKLHHIKLICKNNNVSAAKVYRDFRHTT